MAIVDELAIEIEGSAKGAVSEIDTVIKKLDLFAKKIQNLSGSTQGIRDATSSIKGLGSEMQSISGYSKGLSSAMKPIQNMANAMSRLMNAGSSDAGKNISKVGDTVKNLADDMSQVQAVDSSVNRFVSSIGRLANAGDKSAVVAQQLPAMGTALKDTVQKMAGAADISEPINRFTESIAQLASAGDRAEKTANGLDKLAEKTKGFFNTMKDAPEVSENTIRMTEAMARLASTGGKVGNVSVSMTSSLTNVTRVFGNLNSSVNRTLGKLKDFVSQTRKASTDTKSFAKSVGVLVAKFLALSRAVKGLGSSIGKSMDYLEVLNYFDSAFGQVAEKADLSQWKKLGYSSAETYADSFAERAKQLTSKMTGFSINTDGTLTATGKQSLGIDPSLLMNYQAMFGQMSSSMGVVSENALALSDALTMIGADLASIKNLDFKDVWDDMASGLTGMSRALDKYGVNIRQSALDQKLLELGINTTAKELSQSDKALLRTIILLDSTKYAWGDLAQTINAPANQLRLLRANFENLARTIGNIFLPIVAKVLPYLNAVVIALQRLFTWVGKVLGINISGITSSIGGGAGDALGGILDDLEDLNGSLEDASAAAKKLKNNLLGIDELNIISQEDSDALGNIGTPNVSGLLDKAFYDALDKYRTAWNEAFSGMEDEAGKLADKIVEAAKYAMKPISKAWADEGEFVVKSWENAFTNLGSLIKSIGRDAMAVWQQDKTVDVLKDVFHIVGDIGQAVANLATNFEIAWNKNDTGLHILENIRDIIGAIIHNIRLAADYTVEWTAKLDFTPLLESFEGFTRTLADKMTDISGIFTDFYEVVILGLSKWTVESGIPKLLDVFNDFTNDVDWPKLRSNLNETWKSLERFGETVGEGLIIFIDRLSDSLSGFLNSKEFENFLKFLRNWMDSKTPEDIADGLEKIAKAIVTFKAAALGLKALEKITSVLSPIKNFFDLFKKGGKATQAAETMKKTSESMGFFGKAFQTLGVSLAVAETTYVVGKFVSDVKAWKESIDKYGWYEGRRKIAEANPANPYRNGTALTQEDGSGVLDKWLDDLKKWQKENREAREAEKKEQGEWFGEIEAGISDWWNNSIAPWFTADKWSKAYDSIVTPFRDKWTELKTAFGESSFSTWYEEHVAPIFDKETWENTYDSFVTSFREKWEELKISFSESSFVSWFEENVSPWFTKKKWEETYDSFVSSFNEKWGELKKWFQESKFSDWYEEHVAPWFTKDKWDETYQNIKGSLESTWDSLVSWWESSGLSKWINNNVKPLLTKEKWEENYKNIKDSLESKWNDMVSWWKNSGGSKWIDEHVKPLFEKSKWEETYKNIKESLQGKWGEAVSWWENSGASKWINEHVKPLFQKDKWDETYKNVKESLESKWNDAVSWWEGSGASKWIKQNVEPLFEKSKWEETYKNVKESLKSKWEETVSWWKESGASKWIRENVAPHFEKKKWSETYDTIKSQLQDKWGKAVEWWNESAIVKWWKDDVEPWFDSDKWSFEGIKEGLGEAWDGAIQGMKEKWNTFAGWMNEILCFDIPSIDVFGRQFGGFTIDLGHFPMLASGGIVTTPTFSMIGEAGPEAVIPLSQNSQWIGDVADGVADRLGNNGSKQSDELLMEQNALLRQQNELLTMLLNKKVVATLDRRETLNGLREEASRQGYGLNTSFAI